MIYTPAVNEKIDVARDIHINTLMMQFVSTRGGSLGYVPMMIKLDFCIIYYL